ncbi:Na+/H+ antiporter [Nocardioides jensenii]|uniref:Na+/H+ antiporter n=1 Tax=Nocardioides jensenii TaxID=1843 RepID=UPI00157ADE57|nr:Na+/H+ antiporter [Nocardioides jensenii]
MALVEIAFQLIVLAVAVLGITGLAQRLDFPAPMLLIATGIAASFIPHVPEVHLHHDVVLLGLLPPLLYSAALTTSLVDFNANRRSILLLSVGLVIFTTAGVAVVVHLLLPGVSWAIAIAIGAVVAPPDAVAASAVARRIGLPRRVVTILEGESLLNDATALVSLRMAIAAMSGTVAISDVGLDFVRAAGGGVVVGLVAFFVVAKVRRQVNDSLLDTGISLVTPFAAYLAAEEIGASGVIAVVVAGLLLGHKAPVLQNAQSRIAERMNWRTIAFVLENTVFLLIGLQGRWIIEDVAASHLSAGRIAAICGCSLLAVMVLRMIWVFPVRSLLDIRGRGRRSTQWPSTFVLGWAGMRGVVTLAAAFLIPEGTENREILFLIAFTVVAGTLFLQGLSLPWVARRLGVPSPDPAEDALARATLLHQATEAGFAVIDPDEKDPHDAIGLIKARLDQRNFAVWEQLGNPDGDHETPSQTYARVRRQMIGAERAKVLEVRSGGQVPHNVVQEVLSMLDIEESMIDAATADGNRVRATRSEARAVGDRCEDLTREFGPVEPQTPDACTGCLEEGTSWVHLRMCLDCGYVGCCDSSPRRHASAHFQESSHRVMRSIEPGESWRWCFVHHVTG